MLKKLTEPQAMIFVAIIALFGSIFTGVLSNLNIGEVLEELKDKPSDSLLVDINHNNQISNKLEYIVKELEADKAFLLLFHNGEQYYTGRSIQKFSITNVYPLKHINYAKLYQNIPVGLFSDVFSKLEMAKQHGVLVQKDEEPFNSPTDGNVKTAYYTSIKGEGYKTYYGVLVVHFDKRVDAMNQRSIDLVESVKERIYDIIRISSN